MGTQQISGSNAQGGSEQQMGLFCHAVGGILQRNGPEMGFGRFPGQHCLHKWRELGRAHCQDGPQVCHRSGGRIRPDHDADVHANGLVP
mmetsp:Transcript_7407/g.8619  ORF Transcript_7407/g.8619 Transcript_7407/m.8619 type:complete len:89 (-) Transcript_7407:1191-1457(-)